MESKLLINADQITALKPIADNLYSTGYGYTFDRFIELLADQAKFYGLFIKIERSFNNQIRWGSADLNNLLNALGYNAELCDYGYCIFKLSK